MMAEHWLNERDAAIPRNIVERCLPVLMSLSLVTQAIAAELTIPGQPPNPLVWDAPLKRIKMDGMTNLAVFTFWVTNTARTNVAILRTETSCDCTVAQLPSQPWLLQPGESGPLVARLNVTGKFGVVTNEVGVLTSHGPQFLTVVAEIPFTPAPFNMSPRERDRMIAQRDRQAVFRNASCAACHALPALGHAGETLFVKACAICHSSERRAAMVPDLASLTRATNAVYWREWINHGKVGSLMPAFAKSEGGILDTNQVESLVEYLVKKFPR
jgi:cytochrome c553